MLDVRRVTSIVALLAVAIWLGGLVVLGAVAAPIVFSHVAWPQNADAMSLVFRRFDIIAMACAALVVASEAARATAGPRFTRLDHGRAAASLLAAVGAVVEGMSISPRIAALHAGGAVRGVNAAGLELAHLHGVAEALAKAEVCLLAVVLVLQVLSFSAAPTPGVPDR
jgi:putative copper export protein